MGKAVGVTLVRCVLICKMQVPVGSLAAMTRGRRRAARAEQNLRVSGAPSMRVPPWRGHPPGPHGALQRLGRADEFSPWGSDPPYQENTILKPGLRSPLSSGQNPSRCLFLGGRGVVLKGGCPGHC